MQQRLIHLASVIVMLCTVSSLCAATLESPKTGKTFKVGERVACAGTCGVADGAIVVAFKDKKGVIQQSVAAGVDGEAWTIIVSPPRGGWPPGEMTIEIVSGPKGKKHDSVKITFEK
jgi:hypothetical protein